MTKAQLMRGAYRTDARPNARVRVRTTKGRLRTMWRRFLCRWLAEPKPTCQVCHRTRHRSRMTKSYTLYVGSVQWACHGVPPNHECGWTCDDIMRRRRGYVKFK